MTAIRFRTELSLPATRPGITHQSRLLLVGSCFSDEVGERLGNSGFDVTVNPTGTLYNPMSIADAIERFMSVDDGYEPVLVENEGLWHSMDHHTRFSSSSIDELRDNIGCAQAVGAVVVKAASHIFITLGSAYVFVMKSNDRVVANCHKLHPQTFVRRRLSVGEIVDRWTALLANLHQVNPYARVIFTVSPIRHVADGLHGNQLSKSTLLLAVDELCAMYPDYVSYFPAYEALMDDLRDYRFYADDMVHPSSVAISYVYSLLADAYFDDDTRNKCAECEKAARRARHRSLKTN